MEWACCGSQIEGKGGSGGGGGVRWLRGHK